MTTILYPTPDQVQLAVRWSNRGTRAIDPDNGTARGSIKNKARSNNLVRLRDLIFRLDLPFQYETMRAEVLHRPVAGVDERLLRQIVSSLRVHGYIYEAGPIRDGRTRPVYAAVPLTGYQLHILRLYCAGQTTKEIAQFFGVDVARINAAMRRAKEEQNITSHGLTQLTAHAFQTGWLPTYAEYGALMRSDTPPAGKPYRTVAGWVSRGEGASA